MTSKHRHKRATLTERGRAGDRPDRGTRGTSRRRLLRAVGGSSAALTAILAAKWQKPVLKTVILPAHAQMSPGEQPGGPVGCPVTARVAVDPDDSAVFTVAVQVASTDGAELATLVTLGGSGSATASSSGSSTFESGSYRFIGEVSVDSGGPLDVSSNFTCCDATASLALPVTETSSIGIEFDVSDDGECGFDV